MYNPDRVFLAFLLPGILFSVLTWGTYFFLRYKYRDFFRRERELRKQQQR
jgi:hypothetical protein